jgi:prepilin-type N-terminal cleavage/methylation domain-containing protein
MMTSQKGFTLIEMAIVLAISGVMLGAAIMMFVPYLEYSQMKNTRDKEEIIAFAVAQFAQTYGRLPCPADPNPGAVPFGSPRNSGPDGDDLVSQNCGSNESDYVGMVPFRALGLSEKDILDGYNNYFTYAVSPTMALFNATDSNAPMTTTGLNGCNAGIWKDTSSGANKNIYKAHVCCPAHTSGLPDISILDDRNATNSVYTGDGVNATSFPSAYEDSQTAYNKGAAYYNADSQPCALDTSKGITDVYCVKKGFDYTGYQSVSDCQGEEASGNPAVYNNCMAQPPINQSQHPWMYEKKTGYSSGATYSTVTTYAPQRKVNAAYTISPSQFIAYTLISHGHDGDGAFTKNGGQRKRTKSTTVQENFNEDNNLTFVSRAMSKTENDNYFDDIVLWKTNDQLISQFGNNSCVRP